VYKVMLNIEVALFGLALLSVVPPTTLTVIHFRRGRLWLALTAGLGGIASLAPLLLAITQPWISVGENSFTLYSAYQVLDVVGDIFAKGIMLASFFAVLGATLWLAEIEPGRELFTASSVIGFTLTLAFIASATALKLANAVNVTGIGTSAWASLALYAIGIVVASARRVRSITTPDIHRDSSSTGVAQGLASIATAVDEHHELVRRVLEEAKRALRS
jgi:hypothetical protein